MALFKKSSIVGVSVTPEVGLEVTEIDYETKTVLKYGCKPLDYNANSRQVADMDLFKETLEELFASLQISKSSQIVLNIPAVTFKVSEFPAMMDQVETTNAITESLLANPIFENEELCYSAVRLPSSSMQFNRIAYTAAKHNVIYEMVFAIYDLGYKVYAIDTSVSSTLNALDYIGRLRNIDVDTNWVLMVVENNTCRVMPMNGHEIVDVYEEKISIGEVLGDAENYATVLNAALPVLRNTPSKYLYVVSKTNVISAEILAGKIQYSAPIIHQEANVYSKEAFIEAAPSVDPDLVKSISLDAIGSAIRRDIEPIKPSSLNLYNETLGDLYTMYQPPKLNLFGREIVFTNELLIKLFVTLLIILLIATICALSFINGTIKTKKEEQSKILEEIAAIDRYLEENKNLSSDEFDEGDEIKMGLVRNKAIYSYYTVVGTEIPKKLWLTHLKLGPEVVIEGQADNLESVYSFFRNIKDYNLEENDLKLQKLGLASHSKGAISGNSDSFDTESILTSLNADFYEFRISNVAEVQKDDLKKDNNPAGLPDLEPIN